jgi:hypothetical protein
MIRSYADKVSVLQMLLVDCQGDTMLSKEYYWLIIGPRDCVIVVMNVPGLQEHPYVRDFPHQRSWEAIKSIDILEIWMDPERLQFSE